MNLPRREAQLLLFSSVHSATFHARSTLCYTTLISRVESPALPISYASPCLTSYPQSPLLLYRTHTDIHTHPNITSDTPCIVAITVVVYCLDLSMLLPHLFFSTPSFPSTQLISWSIVSFLSSLGQTPLHTSSNSFLLVHARLSLALILCLHVLDKIQILQLSIG